MSGARGVVTGNCEASRIKGQLQPARIEASTSPSPGRGTSASYSPVWPPDRTSSLPLTSGTSPGAPVWACSALARTDARWVFAIAISQMSVLAAVMKSSRVRDINEPARSTPSPHRTFVGPPAMCERSAWRDPSIQTMVSDGTPHSTARASALTATSVSRDRISRSRALDAAASSNRAGMASMSASWICPIGSGPSAQARPMTRCAPVDSRTAWLVPSTPIPVDR